MQNARDCAIIDAICQLDDHLLSKERKRSDLAPLLAEAKAELAGEAKALLDSCIKRDSGEDELEADG